MASKSLLAEPRPNYGATPTRDRPRKPAIAAILTLFLAASSVALVKAGSGNATVDAFDETPTDCGNYDSTDCVSEYNNAVNNHDLDAFYHRCATEGGANPLRKRCSKCCHCSFCPVKTPETCVAPARCNEAVRLTINNDADAENWAAKGCDMIGGDVTIRSNDITVDGLKKLSGLKRICGALAIQQLALPTLDGLENLELVAGSMVIQQNNWGSDDGNTYLNSLGALSNLRYIGGALAIQQNYHLESLDGLEQAEVGGALDVETYPNCNCGDSFTCLSGCQPVRTTTKCPANDEQCGGTTPRPTISRKPTPQPTPAGPRPTGQPGAGTCCFDSPTTDPCKCSSIAPPDNWCAPSEERCTSCQGAGNWCASE